MGGTPHHKPMSFADRPLRAQGARGTHHRPGHTTHHTTHHTPQNTNRTHHTTPHHHTPQQTSQTKPAQMGAHVTDGGYASQTIHAHPNPSQPNPSQLNLGEPSPTQPNPAQPSSEAKSHVEPENNLQGQAIAAPENIEAPTESSEGEGHTSQTSSGGGAHHITDQLRG